MFSRAVSVKRAKSWNSTATRLSIQLCSAGHGGQIMLSSAAHDALREESADGVAFRRLGRYALAGLKEAETLF